MNIFAIGVVSSPPPLLFNIEFKIEARLAALFMFSLVGDDNGVDVDDDVADVVDRDRDDDKEVRLSFDVISAGCFIVDCGLGLVDFKLFWESC